MTIYSMPLSPTGQSIIKDFLMSLVLLLESENRMYGFLNVIHSSTNGSLKVFYRENVASSFTKVTLVSFKF
jgi:hypothetical protein